MRSFTKLIGLGVVFLVVAMAAPVVTAHEADDPCRTMVVQRFVAATVDSPAYPQHNQTLLWSVYGASQVELRTEGGAWETVDNVGLRVYQPMRDTRYWLRVTNEADYSTETTTMMDVIERPWFVDLTVEPDRIKAGESAKISWSTMHVDYVAVQVIEGADQWQPLSQEELEKMERHPAKGSMTVSPTTTTSYSVYAVGTSEGRHTTSRWDHTVHVD